MAAKHTYTDYARLQHILEHARGAMENLEHHTLSSFVTDEIMRLAILKRVEIIGEAATYLSFSLKKKYEYVDWDELEALRHEAVHEYVGVQFDLVYKSVKANFEKLADEIEGILEMEFGKA
jgi:uncharacterized protein with HEPN domain